MVEVEVLNISDEEIFQKLEELKHLRDENAELKQQLEAEKNKHIKIQYKYHEYTISQLCSRMDKLERLLKAAVEEIHNLKYKQRFVLGYDANFDWEYADEANELIRK